MAIEVEDKLSQLCLSISRHIAAVVMPVAMPKFGRCVNCENQLCHTSSCL